MTTHTDLPNAFPVNIEDEMKQSYMDYAMSVIVGRALPDVRDGLKPVQRRILYAMFREGLLHNRKFSKCAGVVGEVLKKYHPHGDSSVYEALVRLAQPWNLRYPLVNGQGNFGSVDGDPAAAYRYTESRMTAFAEMLLEDIDKDTVDSVANFDDSTTEPLVLPTRIPNLLVNGADGIAVGMATHVLPHNLTEICTAAIAIVHNPQVSLKELLEIVPGPDLPTAGIIAGRAAIASAYATGRGVVQMRARTAIETIKGKSREAQAIVVTEIPYQVNKSVLIEKIAELANDKKIEGISKLRDESDRSGMRIVVELKREATAEVVLNQLYKLTPMQESFGIINLAIVNGRPVVCSLSQCLQHFIDHRRDVVVRRTRFDLRKAEERMHILEGFIIALANLDEVIQLIKTSQTPEEARTRLTSRFALSLLQAQAILDLRLQKLTGMERMAIEKEHAELAAEIERLRAILADGNLVNQIIVKELEEIREKFGDKRRTEIVDDTTEINVEDLIEDEDVVVTVSHAGYIKRTPVNVYRAQKRGGKGIIGAGQKDDDFIEHLFVASTHADVLYFTSAGRLYSDKVYTIPESGRAAKGRALVNLLSLREDEIVTAVLPVKEFSEKLVICMATKQGIIKRVNLMEFSKIRKSGIIACTLEEGDKLIGVCITSNNDEVVLATHLGLAIRFPEEEVRIVGRVARGVIGIRLEPDDYVVSMTVVPKEQLESLAILSICANGYGKRTDLADYRSQGRGGKGVISIQTSGRNGPVVAACAVKDNSGFMLITSVGKIIRVNVCDLSVIGRNTQGVRLIDLEEGETVVAVARLAEDVEA